MWTKFCIFCISDTFMCYWVMEPDPELIEILLSYSLFKHIFHTTICLNKQFAHNNMILRTKNCSLHVKTKVKDCIQTKRNTRNSSHSLELMHYITLLLECVFNSTTQLLTWKCARCVVNCVFSLFPSLFSQLYKC